MRTVIARLHERCWMQLVVAAAISMTSGVIHARALEGQTPVVVSAVHGDVQVTSAGAPVKASVGVIVKLPATVRTGADGSIELRQGETIVSAAPGAQLDIPLSADPAQTLDRITQSSGNVYYSIAKRTSSKLRVETRYLVAVIKGTQFNVAVTGTASTLSLLEGSVELRSADGSDVVDIAAGQVGTLSIDQPRIRVLSLTTGKAIRAGLPSGARSGGGSSASAGAVTTPASSTTPASGASLGSTSGAAGTNALVDVTSVSSAGSSAGGSVMASNMPSGGASGAANATASDTMGALQSLAARTTNGNNGNSGNGNANAGNNGNAPSVLDTLQNLANKAKNNGKGP